MFSICYNSVDTSPSLIHSRVICLFSQLLCINGSYSSCDQLVHPDIPFLSCSSLKSSQFIAEILFIPKCIPLALCRISLHYDIVLKAVHYTIPKILRTDNPPNFVSSPNSITTVYFSVPWSLMKILNENQPHGSFFWGTALRICLKPYNSPFSPHPNHCCLSLLTNPLCTSQFLY